MLAEPGNCDCDKSATLTIKSLSKVARVIASTSLVCNDAQNPKLAVQP